MANHLKMPKKQQVLALLALAGAIAASKPRRCTPETVSRYDQARQANAAKTFPGPDTPPASETPIMRRPARQCGHRVPRLAVKPGQNVPRLAAVTAGRYRDAILEKLDQRLSVQRIWQDLVEEYGYGASYESVKRFVRTVQPRGRPVGSSSVILARKDRLISSAAPPRSIDDGRVATAVGVPAHAEPLAARLRGSRVDQRLRRSCGSRAAFHDLGGVPRTLRMDNQKVAVLRACFFDPDVLRCTRVRRALGLHALADPTPAPQQNGSRSGPAGTSRTTPSRPPLREPRRAECLPAALETARWRACASTARRARQVWTHFVEREQPALLPLAVIPFRSSRAARARAPRRAHRSRGRVSIPSRTPCSARRCARNGTRISCACSRRNTWSRCTPAWRRAVRPAARPNGVPKPSARQRAYLESSSALCRVGPVLRQWAEAAVAERGVRAIRLIQGVLGLTRTYPRARVLHAATVALQHRRFRYKELVRLATGDGTAPAAPALTTEDPAIRPLTAYTLELFPMNPQLTTRLRHCASPDGRGPPGARRAGAGRAPRAARVPGVARRRRAGPPGRIASSSGASNKPGFVQVPRFEPVTGRDGHGRVRVPGVFEVYPESRWASWPGTR